MIFADYEKLVNWPVSPFFKNEKRKIMSLFYFLTKISFPLTCHIFLFISRVMFQQEVEK